MNWILFLMVLLLPSLSIAEEMPEITVTATRILIPVEHIGDDVQIITREEIRKYGFSDISDIIRHFGGNIISNSGGPGKSTSIFMMGLNQEHILVLVDGVPINNPSLTGGQADFRFIDLNNIERIEILKGSQGAIYGSEAIGGVVNIITRKPQENAFSIDVEGGKYKTFKESLYGSVKANNGYLAISSENFKTDGFDSKKDTYTHNPDKDGYKYKTGSISYQIKATPTLRISGTFNLKGGETEYDDGIESYDRYFTLLNIEKDISEKLFIRLKTSHNEEIRSYEDTLWGNSEFKGITRYICIEPVYYVSDKLFISGGGSYRHTKSADTYSGKNTSYIKSVFALAHSEISGIHITTAGRIDSHKTFGRKSTYKLSTAYPFNKTGTTIKAQYGTGFKSPSLSQLYSTFGNTNLKPEKSEGWIIGIRQKLAFINSNLEINYFKNHVWNMIDYNPATNKYENLDRIVSEGVESRASVKLTDYLNIFGSYTHLRAKQFNGNTKKWENLIRRPEISYTSGFNISGRNILISLWADHYSKREDINYNTFRRVTLPSFTTYNCYINFAMNKHTSIFLKGFNLTGKDYELSYGYNTPSRQIAVGMHTEF